LWEAIELGSKFSTNFVEGQMLP